MELISSAGGVIAVASIALQLADSINKLAIFWNNVKDAPEEIRGIVTDLELLTSILTEIAGEAQHIASNTSFVAVLRNCQAKVTILTSLLKGFESEFAYGSSTTRKWAALKAVFKAEKLRKFQDVLERVKSTLILAQQKQQSHSIRRAFQAQRQDLSALSKQFSYLTINQFSGEIPSIAAAHVDSQGSTCTIPPTTIASQSIVRESLWTKKRLSSHETSIQNIFGTITTSSNQMLLRPVDDDDHMPDRYETRYSYTFSPAEWLKSLGCNLDGVQELLINGDASVKDVDSLGCSPLWYAARFHKARLCEYLISSGADRDTQGRAEGCIPLVFGYSGMECSPLFIAASSSYQSTRKSEVIDTLRQFVDLLDFDDDADTMSGWGALWTLIDPHIDRSSPSSAGKEETLLWLLAILTSEIRGRHFWSDNGRKTFNSLLDCHCPKGLEYALRVSPTNAMALSRDPGSYTALHYAIFRYRQLIGPLLTNDVDLHIFGFDEDYSPKAESLTSMAMYNFWTFLRWFEGLMDADKDIERLIVQETHEGPVFDEGWKSSTLRLLFDVDGLRGFLHLGFSELAFYRQNCIDCRYLPYWQICVQPYWFTMLEAVKRGTRLRDWLEKERCNNRSATRVEPELVTGQRLGMHSQDLVGHDTSIVDGTVPIAGFAIDSCPYKISEMICIDCWYYFKQTGERYKPSSIEENPGGDGLPSKVCTNEQVEQVYQQLGEEEEEDKYSPFHVHT